MNHNAFCKNIETVLEELITSNEGLKTNEVLLRQKQQGKNELKAKKTMT